MIIALFSFGFALFSSASEISLIVEDGVRANDSSTMYVQGFVGDKPYKFVLDTGAARTTIANDDFTATFKSESKTTTAGAFAKLQNDRITVPKIQVGPLFQSGLAIDRMEKGTEKNKRNLLGMDFLRMYAFYFLFDENKLVPLKPDQVKNEVKYQKLFMGERFHPYVDLAWKNGVAAKGVWDTGASITVFDSSFIAKNPGLFKRAGSSKGSDSSGTTEKDTDLFEMEAFSLGGQSFPRIKVVGIDLSVPNSTVKTKMDFILGNNVIRKANWVFDFPRKRWAILKLLP